MGLNTVVQAVDRKTGDVLWSVRTRRDFILRWGKAPMSRNDNPNRWRIVDPSGVNSLCEIDEARECTSDVWLSWRYERLTSGNAKQRRKARRACKK